MKKLSFVLGILSFAAISCNKDMAPQTEASKSGEIILTVEDGGIDVSVNTKATAITSVPTTLYFSATTGTGTSQGSKWNSESKSVSSGKVNTGKYQTATATAYNYYLSNYKTMNFNDSGVTIAIDNTEDYVAGVTKASTSTSPSLVLNHVFARTGTISCSSANSPAYTLSNLSYKLTSKSGSNTGTKGTYNIYNDTWSNCTALSATSVTSSSDLYLIPGTYTLTVSGTESLGDYSKSFTASADVTLVAGQVNNISAKRTSSGATGITVSVSLNPWGTNNITPSI